MLNTIALLLPVFLLLVGVEWYISYRRGDERYTAGNTAMNMTIGAMDQIGALFYFVLLYLVLEYVYAHFRLFTLGNNWYQWVLAYVVVDFLSYWYHRFSHEINILWAGHVTHHSSSLFNFSNGFRTSLFQGLNRILFWALLPVFGFSPVILVIILKISGVYDFFLHTQYIPKLGFLEKILITPSQHRVHHGKNELYLDKNYGSTFVILDKLFGTFQEETEPVVYGITSPYVDNNPWVAINYHYVYLWRTMQTIPGWWGKLRLLLMSPAWQPPSIQKNNPPVAENELPVGTYFRRYAWFQVAGCTAGVITVLAAQDFLSLGELLCCMGVLVFFMVSSTKFLNNNVTAGFEKRESARLIFAVLLLLVALLGFANHYLWVLLTFLVFSLVLVLVAPPEADVLSSVK